MRKFIRISSVAAVALAASALTAQAQEKQVGILAGATFATMTGDDISNTSTVTSFAGGIYALFPSSERFGFEVDALYAGKGVSDADNSDNKITTGYIEIPVLARYGFTSVTDGIYLLGGGAVGFNISCNVSDSSGDVACSDTGFLETNTTFGVVVGAGFQKKRFGIEGRYDFDLGDTFKDFAAKNAVWEVMARIAIK